MSPAPSPTRLSLTLGLSVSGLFTARYLLLIRAYRHHEHRENSESSDTHELSTFNSSLTTSRSRPAVTSIMDGFRTEPARPVRETIQEVPVEEPTFGRDFNMGAESNDFVQGSSSGITLSASDQNGRV